jgi:formylglycine-generating enzyme required for sulfatase activity
VEEGRGILVELAGQIGTNPGEENAVSLRKQHEEQQRQVEDLELQLAKADATLAQLRSQHDLLEARLKAAQAQHALEADRPRSSRRYVAAGGGGVAGFVLLLGIVLVLTLRHGTPVVEPVVPQPSELPAIGVDLLAIIDVKRDSVEGEWRFDKGVLVSPDSRPGRLARLQVPFDVPDEYDLELIAERSKGNGGFMIGLVGDGNQFSLMIDNFEGDVSGLSILDGDAKNPESTRRERLLRDGVPAKVVCQVREGRVRVTVDKNDLVDWSGDLSRFSLFYGWQVPNKRALIVGAESSIRVHRLTLVPRPGSRPSAASRPLTVALYGLGGKVAMEPTQFPPEWKTPGEFAWIGAPGRMTFPTLPVSDYVMETELTFRKVGNGHIDYELGHPRAGETSVALGCLWPQDQNATGVPCRLFNANRGGVNWDGEEHFPVGQRLRLKLVAAGHNRALFCNGGRVLNALAIPMDTTLTISAFGGVDCTIHACTLRELRAEDVAGLGWTAPQRTLDLKPEMAAARIDKQTGALGERPEPSKAFLVKSIGAPISWVPPGEFDMGNEAPHAVWGGIEGAAGGKHRVRLTRGFWMGRYEVTQQQWMKLSHSNPSRIQGSPYLPVNWISWQEAVDFCAKLHQKEKQAGRLPEGFQYRLPTEAEWEYACRTGMDDAKELDQKQFWFAENSENRLHEVGEWPPNRWGLYDMLGNVEEWCFDVWQPYQAQSGIVLEDPFELSAGKDDWFPVRGGAWWSWDYRHPWPKYTSDATLCTWRNCSPSIAGAYRGFRLVLGRNLGEIAVPGRK